ncbi:MAG TPA: aspartate aminotransferase family protein [Gemmatimonadaceae bacterium]|nr:aspartate aminotransferase family protein [Gemmatimonadaceae bacterium]
MIAQKPSIKTEIPGPKSRAMVADEAPFLAPGIQSISTLSGLAVARGEGSVIEDVDGNQFLDIAAGVCVNALGHAHPRYTQILKEQIDEVTVGSLTTPRRAEALKKVASHTPEGLDKIQLYSGGTEAVEAAMRLAKSHTKKFEFLSFWGGFHGKTAGSMSLIGDGTKNQLGPSMPGTYIAPYASCYRCPLKLEYPSCGIACADFTKKVIKNNTTGALAAVFMEPIQGTAGNVVPPPEFMPAIQQIAKENDALLVSDEMITGFGRTGTWFGCEHFGVTPDIVTMGKGLGSGFPVSGLASTVEITQAKPWGSPSGSSSSYGGNPMAGAAILASVTVIEEEKLVENAERVGALMLKRLREMQEKHAFIGDVRGKGLLIGVELVKDRKTKEPLAKDVCVRLFRDALNRGLMSMVYSPSFRINPPLSISEATADTAMSLLDETFTKLTREGGWQ